MKIQPDDFPTYRPIAFVPSLNRILLGPFEMGGLYRGRRSEEGSEGGPFSFLDPATGKISSTDLDVRPLAQQTIRPLQAASTAFEFWAAIPDEKETAVGIYNARSFTFRPVMTISDIKFDSMDIWVDANKLYFTYEGHLLSAPLKIGR